MEKEIKRRIRQTKKSLKYDLLTGGERCFLEDELKFLNGLLIAPTINKRYCMECGDEFIDDKYSIICKHCRIQK